MTRQVRPVVAVTSVLLTIGCSGSLESEPSVDLLQPRTSQRVVDADDSAICRAQLADMGREVALIATDRRTYREVAESMVSKYGSDALESVPDMSADAIVTLCRLDTSANPGHPPVLEATLAVASETSWWADGQLG